MEPPLVLTKTFRGAILEYPCTHRANRLHLSRHDNVDSPAIWDGKFQRQAAVLAHPRCRSFSKLERGHLGQYSNTGNKAPVDYPYITLDAGRRGGLPDMEARMIQ